MQIEVTEVEPCRLSIHYTADALEILTKRAAVLETFKRAPVPGFRPGKATPEALNMHYRNQIDESVKRALAEDAYHNTLFEKKIKPHGAPRFNNLLLANGKFVAEFDLHTKPDFELPEYANLVIPKPHQEDNEVSMSEKMLQDLRVRVGEVVPYDENDQVANGDNVILDFEGFRDGERVESLCAEGEMLTVGASSFEFFDQNILGMKIGETREFDLQVPEGAMPSVSGKSIHMKVTVHTGSKTTPFPLDDTLGVRLGKANLDELREYVRGQATSMLQNKFKSLVNEAVSNKLVESTTIAVPNWMALSEAQYLAHNSKLEWSTLEDVDRERFMQLAERNVKLSLILDAIRDKEPTAQLTDQEVFEVIKTNIAKTQIQKSIDEVMEQMNKTGYLQILFSRIRDEHTMDFVTKTVQFVE